MKKFFLVILSLFPILASADGALTFTPPATDYSVTFLGNLFGVVDGVLHGTGSQIMGAMFSVFNAAVLALGGIIIMYTLIVATMNTAHEGQMLGQKWSSIWIPVRATMGLALLIPKASGYCLMQIFVMWVVVQGVGAADKVWNGALDYLNRGGVIIKAEPNPGVALLSNDDDIPKGAQVMLAGQVCMIALQQQLQTQLNVYKAQAAQSIGPCALLGVDPDVTKFCNAGEVPSFSNTVDVVGYQQSQDQTNPPKDYTVPMPNFDGSSIFSKLNGICGSIHWNAFSKDSFIGIPGLTQADMATASMSRVIAVSQVYMDMGSLAQTLVGNDPALGKVGAHQTQNNNFAPFAIAQLGFPYDASGNPCQSASTPQCITWGSSPGATSAPLLTGTEFSSAINDYNGIMFPTMNLINNANTANSTNAARAFISKASTEGWVMAGSYFINLINLNVQASSGGNTNIDTQSGLGGSNFDPTFFADVFDNSSCGGRYPILCTWMTGGNPANITITAPMIKAIESLIDGRNYTTPVVSVPKFSDTNRAVTNGIGASTAYGFINNSTILQSPGQPGQSKNMKFPRLVNPDIDYTIYSLPSISFGCGHMGFYGGAICIGSLLGELMYNVIMVPLYNGFVVLIATFISQAFNLFLLVPLEGMAEIFNQGVEMISLPNVNPVIALANMGTYYINFAASMWINILTFSTTVIIIPWFGGFILAFFVCALPIIMAWLGVMVSIGFSTAYFIPVLPYMIFTFGAIAWLMAVIEAMVAAPIVALGITHPEGHDAFGKGEGAIMILLNVFLRPAMMIIGYISAIALSYVSVWVINAGFINAISFMSQTTWNAGATSATSLSAPGISSPFGGTFSSPISGTPLNSGYTSWAGVFAVFLSLLLYTSMYVTVVQKAFTLIAILPDKVLRWIGGTPESAGQDAAQWAQQEVKGKMDEGSKASNEGAGQMHKAMAGRAEKNIAKIKAKIGGALRSQMSGEGDGGGGPK